MTINETITKNSVSVSHTSPDIAAKTKMVMDVFGDLINTLVETANTKPDLSSGEVSIVRPVDQAHISVEPTHRATLSRTGRKKSVGTQLAADHQAYIAAIASSTNESIQSVFHTIIEHYANSYGYPQSRNTSTPVISAVAEERNIRPAVTPKPVAKQTKTREVRSVTNDIEAGYKILDSKFAHRPNLNKMKELYRLSVLSDMTVADMAAAVGLPMRRTVEYRSELATLGLITISRRTNQSSKMASIAPPVVPEIAEIIPAEKVSESVFPEKVIDPNADMTEKFAASRSRGRPKKYQLEELVVNQSITFPMTDLREVLTRSKEVEAEYKTVKFFMAIKTANTGSIQRIR